MALKEGNYPVRGELYVLGASPANYVGSLVPGEILSTRAVGFKMDIETYDSQKNGTIFEDAAILGYNVVLELVIAGLYPEIADLQLNKLNPQSGSDTERVAYGVPANYKWGHKVKNAGLTHNLLLKADEFATEPSLYIPHAIVTEVGPIQWSNLEDHQEASVLTIIGLMDDETGGPFHYGVEAELPATPRGD